MIRLVKNNNPFNVVILVIYAVCLKLVLFIHPQVPDVLQWSEPLSRLTLHLLLKLRLVKPLSFSVLSIIYLLVVALYFNVVIGNYKLNAKGVFLPALFILLSGSFTFSFCQFSPILIGLIFLLAALSRTYSLYKREEASGIMFDTGFLISIASLFYFPYIVFVLFLLIGFIVARPFNLREYLVGLSGIIIPYFLVGVFYYWNNSMLEYGLIYRKYFTADFFHFLHEDGINYLTTLFALLLLFLWSTFPILKYYSKAVMQHRIIILLTYIFFFTGAGSILFLHTNNLQNFMWLIFPVSFTVSIAIAELRKRWIGEIVHLCLILLLIYFQFFVKS